MHVPRNTVVETPIHLLFLATPALENCAAAIRNLIVLEEGAQATIILSFANSLAPRPIFPTWWMRSAWGRTRP